MSSGKFTYGAEHDLSSFGLYLAQHKPLGASPASAAAPGLLLERELDPEETPLAPSHEFGFGGDGAAAFGGAEGKRLVVHFREFNWRPGPGPLGFSLYKGVEGAGLVVRSFDAGDETPAQAEVCGLLCEGDELLAINGQSVSDLSFDSVKALLGRANGVDKGVDEGIMLQPEFMALRFHPLTQPYSYLSKKFQEGLTAHPRERPGSYH